MTVLLSMVASADAFVLCRAKRSPSDGGGGDPAVVIFAP